MAAPTTATWLVRRRRADGGGNEFAEVETSAEREYSFYYPLGFQLYVRASSIRARKQSTRLASRAPSAILVAHV